MYESVCQYNNEPTALFRRVIADESEAPPKHSRSEM